MIEEKIEFEILPADFEGNLTPDEGKAGAQFEQELAQVLKQAPFQIPLPRLGG